MELEQVVAGLLLCVLLSGQLVTSNVIPQNENETQNNQGLYDDDDLVYVLNVTNFNSSVHDEKRAWVVEFYNRWCGHCHRFAPFWSALGKSIYGWRDIVAIGAVDCANDDNNPFCREYKLERYPTIKFFHFKSMNDKLGIPLQIKLDENFLRQKIIDQLVKDEQDQEAGPNWPNLVPYRNSEIKPLWETVPKNVDYQFLIFEEPEAYLGAEVILDLHKLGNTRIRRLTSNNLVLTSAFNINKFPTLVVIERNGKSEHLKTEILTREEVVKAITRFLESKGVSTEIKEDEFDKIHIIGHLSKDNVKTNEQHLTRDRLYRLDLEAAVRYSLNNEIPLALNIFGEKMTALKTYLKVIAKYFPADVIKMKNYLEVLQDIIEAKSNMTGKEFKEQVKQIEKGLMPIYSAPKTWIGCKGSKSTFRGYPCGLWTLFHMLTVAAAEVETKKDKNDTPSVLEAMHGYIKNFFGCADCAQHFQEMSAKRKLFESRSRDDDILWLWQAHNEVNQRLAGDLTEDPEHKKIQYPSVEHCPDCRLLNGKWNEHEVLKYLKVKYSKENIDFEGINMNQLHQEINNNAANSSASHKKLGWDFTVFDFSICVMLYAVLAIILYNSIFSYNFTSVNDKLGIPLEKNFDQNILRQKIIDLLEANEQDQEAGPNWPNLVPYSIHQN